MTPRVPPAEPIPTSLPERTRIPEPPVPAAAASRRWRSAELLGNQHEVEISHGTAVYRLRLTSLGKLILTK